MKKGDKVKLKKDLLKINESVVLTIKEVVNEDGKTMLKFNGLCEVLMSADNFELVEEKTHPVFGEQEVALDFYDKNEIISIKNGDKIYEFEKPDFECEIFKIIKGQYIGYYINKANYPIACQWNSEGHCFMGSIQARDYSLTPIKKPWYEVESNFPCLCKVCDEELGRTTIQIVEGFDNLGFYCSHPQVNEAMRFQIAERLSNQEIEQLKT